MPSKKKKGKGRNEERGSELRKLENSYHSITIRWLFPYEPFKIESFFKVSIATRRSHLEKKGNG